MYIKTIEDLKKEYMQWHDVFDKLRFEQVEHLRDDMSEEEKEIEQERVKQVRETIEALEEKYDEWKFAYDLFDIVIEWSEEIYGYVKWEDERYFYEDWLSDSETNNKVHESIEAVDEKEVELFIENARKVLESIGYTHDFDVYETHEYIDYIEYINRDLRHDIDNGCMSVLAMDILENRGLWVPYREGFSECLNNVSGEIDSTFLNFDRDNWDYEDDECLEEDED